MSSPLLLSTRRVAGRLRTIDHQSSLAVDPAATHDADDRQLSAAATSNETVAGDLQQRLSLWNTDVISALRRSDYASALQTLETLFEAVGERALDQAISQRIDRIVTGFTEQAFAPPCTYERARTGLRAVRLQLHCSSLSCPYDCVPKRTFLNALKALTSSKDLNRSSVTDAFRILQRLITGHGVRTRQSQVHELDFNLVLNAAAELGEMSLAHRIVALQERTPHAPKLSPVAYSILLKGHGRLCDRPHVDLVVEQARQHGIKPDIVLMNSLMDAYINCGDVQRARRVLESMLGARNDVTGLLSQHVPTPNGRTFNTLLKGLANAGKLREALEVAENMRSGGLWDAVTTNTIVHAAVIAGDMARAEQTLNERTETYARRGGQHPNVEAYTELLDAHAKASKLDTALQVLQIMRQRGVEPNEITYTCMIAGFGRHQKLEQAYKMLNYMTEAGIKPSCVTYNALISSLVGQSDEQVDIRTFAPPPVMNMDETMEQALRVLRDMIRAGVRPNAVTVSTLVYALGQCTAPRIKEAKALVHKFEREGVITRGDSKVVTALMHTYGVGRDVKGAVEAFRSLRQPDTVAINVFLDLCCRYGRDKLAFETFDYYFRSKRNGFGLKPDVISHTLLISSLLKHANSEALITRAHSLYEQMKQEFKVFPDKTLVDIIFKALVRTGRSRSLSKAEVRFAANVLTDAEGLNWTEGQLDRRKRALRSVLAEKLRSVWVNENDLYDLLRPSEGEDELFRRKGWNKVDSGFRLWGSAATASEEGVKQRRKGKKVVDKFLESKGWNDVDSGFRVI